jgi:hypothetical protein
MSKLLLSEARNFIREAAEHGVDRLPAGFNEFTKLYIHTLREEAQIPAPLIVPAAVAHYQRVTRGLEKVRQTGSKKKA